MTGPSSSVAGEPGVSARQPRPTSLRQSRRAEMVCGKETKAPEHRAVAE